MSKIHTIDIRFLDHSEAIAAFLVETSEGPVLVESGPFSTFENLKKGIEAIGFQAEDIKHVFLSHIHFDHAGAAWWFAKNGAHVHVHPKGYKHMLDPSKLVSSATRIYGDMMDVLWGKMETIPEALLHEVEHATSIQVGDTTFQAWHTPGHAVHHIAWQVGKDLFSGDVGGVKINGGPVVPPCPPPDIHVEDWKASIALIKTLDIERMHLTHFGMVENVHEHLEQLETRLQKWADWMKPHFDNQTEQTKIVPLFEAMTLAELKENGVTDEVHLGQYNAANPAYMSVAGLMRYWKKRMEV